MDSKRKFFEIRISAIGGKAYAWPTGFGPLNGPMPFLHPTQLERLREFWKVNPWPPGIYIETGRIWPDFLGHGGGSPSFFVTERVLESMRTEGLTITRATEIPIGQIDSKALKDKPPPRYFVVETAPGIEVDFAATGIPTDAEGKPVLNPLPKPWPPVAWRLRLSSWNGADLFCYSNFGGSLTLVCTEKVVELAKREGWTNCRFEPVWAV